MRRTKHRRRYHTGRVISNRRRRGRTIEYRDGWWSEHPPPNGRLRDRFYFRGCGNSRCQMCHWDKLDPSRRARETRSWKRRVDEALLDW